MIIDHYGLFFYETKREWAIVAVFDGRKERIHMITAVVNVFAQVIVLL